MTTTCCWPASWPTPWEEGKRMQGRNLKLKHGRHQPGRTPHPVASRIPLVGGYFDVGPVAMSGTGTSIQATSQRLGPSMRFIADLSAWDSGMNLTVGQSGHFKRTLQGPVERLFQRRQPRACLRARGSQGYSGAEALTAGSVFYCETKARKGVATCGKSAPRFALASMLSVQAEVTYQKPPKEIQDVLNAPATPTPSISPEARMCC